MEWPRWGAVLGGLAPPSGPWDPRSLRTELRASCNPPAGLSSRPRALPTLGPQGLNTRWHLSNSHEGRAGTWTFLAHCASVHSKAPREVPDPTQGPTASGHKNTAQPLGLCVSTLGG